MIVEWCSPNHCTPPGDFQEISQKFLRNLRHPPRHLISIPWDFKLVSPLVRFPQMPPFPTPFVQNCIYIQVLTTNTCDIILQLQPSYSNTSYFACGAFSVKLLLRIRYTCYSIEYIPRRSSDIWPTSSRKMAPENLTHRPFTVGTSPVPWCMHILHCILTCTCDLWRFVSCIVSFSFQRCCPHNCFCQWLEHWTLCPLAICCESCVMCTF